MRKRLVAFVGALALAALPAAAQQTGVEAELRAELAAMKQQLSRIEAMLERLVTERAGAPRAEARAAEQATPESRPAVQGAPGLNTPPMLPASQQSAFRKNPPRFDVLLQVRGDFFADTSRNDTFFLRKAELGVKGHIADNVDFSLELDPVRPNDPLRRTYIRLTHLPRLHVKLGLEKAPIGLEELTATSQISFVDRSEVTDRFAAAEELGVHLESRWDHWLFQFSTTNGGRRLLRDDNKDKDFTGRVVWAPQRWISVGAATLHGSAGPSRLDRRRYSAELKLGSNLRGFQTEFYRAQDGAILSSAFYTAAYWALPVDAGWMTHWQPVARYEFVGRSNRDPFEELRLLTLGFNVLFSEHRSKFQVNYLKDLHTGARKDELRAQYVVEF